MWMFRIRQERKLYYDAARLVKRVATIESKLERFGGTGGGLYEKYASLSSKFPPEMKEKIISLGIARNAVVHGDPQIKEKEKVFALCEEIETIVTDQMKHEGISTRDRSAITMLWLLVILGVVLYLVWEYILKR